MLFTHRYLQGQFTEAGERESFELSLIELIYNQRKICNGFIRKTVCLYESLGKVRFQQGGYIIVNAEIIKKVVGF